MESEGNGNWEVKGGNEWGKLSVGDLVMYKQKMRFRHSPDVGYFGAAWLKVTETGWYKQTMKYLCKNLASHTIR